MKHTTLPPTTPAPPTEQACPHCGVIDQPQLGPGLPPHAFRASCRHCGHFIAWVSRYTPSERTRRREAWRLKAMAGKPPTVAQLAYLRALGVPEPLPVDRAEAAVLIGTVLAQQGGTADGGAAQAPGAPCAPHTATPRPKPGRITRPMSAAKRIGPRQGCHEA
jgi:hypothetical protein